jgi:hypothetical protein
MSEHLYLISIGLVFGTILVIFGMRYYSAIQQARARFEHGDAYRQVAEKGATAQAEAATSLSAIQASLADINARMTAVEKILKDVG